MKMLQKCYFTFVQIKPDWVGGLVKRSELIARKRIKSE